MVRKLEVYGWTGFRGGKQTRDIVAARSVAEVLRISGISRSMWNWSGCESKNPKDIEIAMSDPGVVFWTEYGDHRLPDAVWHKDPRKEPAT